MRHGQQESAGKHLEYGRGGRLRIKAAQGSYSAGRQDKDIQEVRELTLPKALPGESGGDMPGGSKAEGRREGKVEGG